MKLAREFWHFTAVSWSYMQGQRLKFVLGFPKAWHNYYKLLKIEGVL